MQNKQLSIAGADKITCRVVEYGIYFLEVP